MYLFKKLDALYIRTKINNDSSFDCDYESLYC